MNAIARFRWPLIVFLAGLLIKIFGAWAKILHKAWADITLTTGLFLEGVAVVAAIIILLRWNKNKS